MPFGTIEVQISTSEFDNSLETRRALEDLAADVSDREEVWMAELVDTPDPEFKDGEVFE